MQTVSTVSQDPWKNCSHATLRDVVHELTEAEHAYAEVSDSHDVMIANQAWLRLWRAERCADRHL